MNKTAKATLMQIEKMLTQVVGVQKVEMMTVPELLTHAVGEIEKAQRESFAKSKIRLALLQKSVMYSSASIEDEDVDSIKVPVFVVDQTTLDEQDNELTPPLAAAAKNPSGKSLFENGDVQKYITQLQEQIGELAKAAGIDEEDDDTEEAKAKKAAKKPAPPAGDEPEPEPAAKRVAKSAKADNVWPEDMNDPSFVKTGKSEKDLDWGPDQ